MGVAPAVLFPVRCRWGLSRLDPGPLAVRLTGSLLAALPSIRLTEGLLATDVGIVLIVPGGTAVLQSLVHAPCAARVLSTATARRLAVPIPAPSLPAPFDRLLAAVLLALLMLLAGRELASACRAPLVSSEPAGSGSPGSLAALLARVHRLLVRWLPFLWRPLAGPDVP